MPIPWYKPIVSFKKMMAPIVINKTFKPIIAGYMIVNLISESMNNHVAKLKI